jgi:hypothetical protein
VPNRSNLTIEERLNILEFKVRELEKKSFSYAKWIKELSNRTAKDVVYGPITFGPYSEYSKSGEK